MPSHTQAERAKSGRGGGRATQSRSGSAAQAGLGDEPGIFGELSFENIRSRIDEITPEQAQGLLAFGAELLRSPQLGETTGSKIASGAQLGFATTKSIRDKKAAAQAKEAELLLKVSKEQREQATAERERTEFEERNDPKNLLRGVDLSKMTPESLQVFSETGDFSDLKFNPDAVAGGSTVNIGAGGEERFGLTKTETSRQQKLLSGAVTRLDRLDRIMKTTSDKFVGLNARIKGAIGQGLDFLGFADPNDKDSFAAFNAERSTSLQNIEDFFNQYRKEITGAAAAFKELALLKTALLGNLIGPQEFNARISNLLKNARQDIARSQDTLKHGLPAGPVDPVVGAQVKGDAQQQGTAVSSTGGAPVIFVRNANGQIVPQQ